MPTREIFFFGRHNGPPGTEAATVIVPRSVTSPLPVLYLLHGLTHDNNSWVDNTDIERQVRNLPLIVVMPNGLRGFYTDSDSDAAANYESAIVDDMIRNIDGRFKTIGTREGRVIAGNSMGGYGALKLALKHPDKFSAAFSLSGALRKGSSDYRVEQAKEWAAIFGTEPAGGPHDLVALAEHADRGKLPRIGLDCGLDDSMLHESRHFHENLTRLAIAHDYVELPGGHNWEYWKAGVPRLLSLVRDAFSLDA